MPVNQLVENVPRQGFGNRIKALGWLGLFGIVLAPMHYNAQKNRLEELQANLAPHAVVTTEYFTATFEGYIGNKVCPTCVNEDVNGDRLIESVRYTTDPQTGEETRQLVVDRGEGIEFLDYEVVDGKVIH